MKNSNSVRKVGHNSLESVQNPASDASDSTHDEYSQDEAIKDYFESDGNPTADTDSLGDDDTGPEEGLCDSRTRSSDSEPFPEVPRAPLLTQQQEGGLGQEIRESRDILTKTLAEIPASIVVFMKGLEAARVGNRLATDVLHAPIQGGINSATRDKPDDRYEGNSTATDAAHQAKLLAKLERGYAKWSAVVTQVDPDNSIAQFARQRMVNAYIRVKPGIIILAEALKACQQLENMFHDIEKQGFYPNSAARPPAKHNQLLFADSSDSALSLCVALDAGDEEDVKDIETMRLQIRHLMGVKPLRFQQYLRVAAAAESRYHVAREQIVKSNLRLAISIAREHQGRGLALEDLIQEAMIGLIRAADKFDDRLGCRFSTYACTWIRAATIKALVNSSRTVRLSANTQSKIHKISRLSERLRRNLGREPTRKEITMACHLDEAEIDDLLTMAQQSVSLDTPVREAESLTLQSLVENSSQIDPADWAYSHQLSAEIAKLLETLSRRDALVVRLRFGIDGAEPLTLKRIGQLLGVSRERIRQLEVHALAHLRRNINPDLQQVLTD